jgi:hypothetical protein
LTQIISFDAVTMRTVIMQPISCRDLITVREIFITLLRHVCIPVGKQRNAFNET